MQKEHLCLYNRSMNKEVHFIYVNFLMKKQALVDIRMKLIKQELLNIWQKI